VLGGSASSRFSRLLTKSSCRHCPGRSATSRHRNGAFSHLCSPRPPTSRKEPFSRLYRTASTHISSSTLTGSSDLAGTGISADARHHPEPPLDAVPVWRFSGPRAPPSILVEPGRVGDIRSHDGARAHRENGRHKVVAILVRRYQGKIAFLQPLPDNMQCQGVEYRLARELDAQERTPALAVAQRVVQCLLSQAAPMQRPAHARDLGFDEGHRPKRSLILRSDRTKSSSLAQGKMNCSAVSN